jgi:hypothetical protein
MPTKRSAAPGASPPKRTAKTDPKPSRRTPAPPEPALQQPPSLDWLMALWKPSELEQRLVMVLLAASGRTSVSELAQTLSVPITQVLSVLAPQQLLRGTALVEVTPEAELGHLQPHELVVLGRGLLAAAHDREAIPTYLPGLTMLPTPEPDAAWAAAFVADRPAQLVLDLVKEKLVSVRPLLLLLSGCSGETTSLLTQAVRLRLARPVFYLDASALAGWPQPDLVAALRRLRRDADVRGAALVVQDVEQLGAGWRALTHPKPHGQTSPVILCSSGALAVPRHFAVGSYGSPLQLHGHTLRSQTTNSAGTATATAQTTAATDSEPPEVDRSREEARRQAAVDAARAMGKPIPKELLTAATTAPHPATTTSQAAAAPASAPAKPVATVETAKAETPPRTEAPAAPSSPRPVNPRLAAALAKAGLPPPPAAAPRAEPPAAPPPAPATQAPPPPAAAPAVATQVATSASAESRASDDAPDGPPLPLSEDAKLDEVINVAKITPNNSQRCELLRRLEGAKSPLVIALFRMFVSHSHPGVRAAAEAGMASLFGANWNRARSIAPPAQPPRSEDNGRGPGGAF